MPHATLHFMPYPQDALSQHHLVGHLREAIDRVSRYDDREDIAGMVKYGRAKAVLDSLLDLNPHAAASRHVQHNIGARRRAWLAEYQRVRAGADAKSS